MKQFPKLSLVAKEDPLFDQSSGETGGGRAVSGFELVAPDDLLPAERDSVQQRVVELFPKSVLIAAARTPRSWDLRPVITRSGEHEPSIIRFAGPEISTSVQLNTRTRETFERLKSFRELSSSMLSWGEWHGELYYRRPLVERTLAHLLAANERLDAEQVFGLARGLAEEVAKWHERGVVHGHLTSSNIVLRANNRIALLDAGIGLASVQAARGVLDYNLKTFAPELLGSQSASLRSDLYGLGLVLRRLFVHLSQSVQGTAMHSTLEPIIRPLTDLSNALLENDPGRRPDLLQVRKILGDAMSRFGQLVKKKQPRIKTGVVQGRIHRSGQPDLLGREAGLPAEPMDHFVPPEPLPIQSPAANPIPDVAVAPPPAVQAFIQQQSSAYHPQQMPPQSQPVVFSGGPDAQTNIYQLMATQTPQQPMPAQPLAQQQMPHPHHPQQHPYAPQMPPPQQQQMGYPVAPIQGLPQMQQAYSYPSQYGQPMPYANAPNVSQAGGNFSVAREATTADASWIKWMVVFLLFLGGFWYYRTHGVPSFLSNRMSREEMEQLRDDWNSLIPSRMTPVALAAIDKDNPSSEAESIILSSIRSDDFSSTGVNVGLLRVAFDERWEMELTKEDRRVALALGMGGLLKSKVPRDLASLDELHPGVVLSLVSSIGASGGKTFFAAVPVTRLAELPPPYGPAFKMLSDLRPGLTCGDEAVQRLARLGTKGVEFDDVAVFLKDNTVAHLQALAMMYSQDNTKAQTLLDILLTDANQATNDPLVGWARAFDLVKWTELESSDRLLLLSGIAPAGKVSSTNLGRLLSHPLASLRAYAMKNALTSIKLEHPGAVAVLQILQKDPQLLKPEQTVELMMLLANPVGQQVKTVRAWLESNPPMQLVVPLLLSTAEQKQSTILDTSLAVYLKGKNWKPNLEMLRRLSTHPDSYTRLFAYGEIYLMDDRETAREFLASAEKRETEEDNRQQLNQMLLDLAH